MQAGGSSPPNLSREVLRVLQAPRAVKGSHTWQALEALCHTLPRCARPDSVLPAYTMSETNDSSTGRKVIHVRLTEQMQTDIDALSSAWDAKTTEIVRRALRESAAKAERER